jgi:hypothetical protein
VGQIRPVDAAVADGCGVQAPHSGEKMIGKDPREVGVQLTPPEGTEDREVRIQGGDVVQVGVVDHPLTVRDGTRTFREKR